jgi:methionyl-tRNA formyltransferase
MATVMDSAFVVVLIGHGTMAAQGLAHLVGRSFEGKITIPLVVCNKHDSGMDSKFLMDDGTPFRRSLRKAAFELGFEEGQILCGDPNSKVVRQHIAMVQPDLILSLQCREIFRANILSIPKRGTLNVHNAPLPLLRGCDPFTWAIHDGLKTFGVTLHCVDLGVDSGDIVEQRTFPISDSDTAWSLFQKSLPHSIRLLSGSLLNYLRKDNHPIPQDHRFVTYHPMNQFNFQPLEIEWNTVALTLSAWIRARIFPPYQLPFFWLPCKTEQSPDVKIEVFSCHAVECSSTTSPGMARVTAESCEVDAVWGTIVIATVRVEGNVLSGAEFAKTFSVVTGTCFRSRA